MKTQLHAVQPGPYPCPSARVPSEVVPGYALVRPGPGTGGGGAAQTHLLQVQRVHRVLGARDGACGRYGVRSLANLWLNVRYGGGIIAKKYLYGGTEQNIHEERDKDDAADDDDDR